MKMWSAFVFSGEGGSNLTPPSPLPSSFVWMEAVIEFFLFEQD